jgi:hypothetical protein
VANEEDEAPITSKSPERALTARAQADELASQVQRLIERASRDPESTYAERAALLRTALAVVRLRGQLTGELGASEAVLAASPQWKRLLSGILEALQPFPDAARAVLSRLENVTEMAA